MNILEIYQFIKSLENSLQGKVTLGIQEPFGFQIRVLWMYKEKVIQWQYVISLQELDTVQDNSAFILYLIEKARTEHQSKKWEIDTDDRT